MTASNECRSASKVASLGRVAWPLVFVSLLATGYIAAEICWTRINSPVGRFTTVAGYLAQGRMPSRVELCSIRGGDFWVAYAPMNYGLALPSGPAAYVFDDQGRLVDWSADTGDDSRFTFNWPSKAMTPGSIEDLNRLAAGSAPGPRGDAGRSVAPDEVPR